VVRVEIPSAESPTVPCGAAVRAVVEPCPCVVWPSGWPATGFKEFQSSFGTHEFH